MNFKNWFIFSENNEKNPLCKKIVNIVCRYKSKLERIATVDDDDYYANQLNLTLKPFIKVCNLI